MTPHSARLDPPEGDGRLAGRDLRLAYDSRVIVDGLSVTIPDSGITAIVGANGCGKSTLLRALARLLKPKGGGVLLDGQSIHRMPTKQVARELGLLAQSPVVPDGITVGDLVIRGRSPHQRMFQQWSDEDERAVLGALEATETLEFTDRRVDELSGGQRQRVWIAMALAQDTPILLLDEPTTFLDITHQMEVLDLISELNEADGRTIVLVLHDLNQACRYATHIIAMKDGAIAAAGPPHEVITPEVVSEVFGLDCTVIDDPECGTPLVIPRNGRRARRAAPVNGGGE